MTPPVLGCGLDSDTIVPPDAPISFMATVEDNCGAEVEVTGYDS